MSDGTVFATVNVSIDVEVGDTDYSSEDAEQIVKDALLADDRIKAVTLKTSEIIIDR